VHDSDVEIRREPYSSLLWALGTLAFTTVTFLALYTVRFSGIGIWLAELPRIFALFASADVFWFAHSLEGPLYVSVRGSSTPEFQVDGASGFHGIEIYGPEHSKAEWHGDDIGLIWSFDWQRPVKFPPMRLRFAHGTLPPGYSQKTPLVGATPALDPDATLTVVIRPAMGMPEHFTLHGGSYQSSE
jgi:hypothetical protein